MQARPDSRAAHRFVSDLVSVLRGQMLADPRSILRQGVRRPLVWRLLSQWGPGFGSVHDGDARRSIGISGSVCSGHGDHGSPWGAVSGGYVGDQRFRIVPDRRADDASYRAAAAASQLAASAGCRIPGGLYNFLQLRMGDADVGQGRRAMAGVAEHGRKRGVRIHGRVARIDDGGKTVIQKMTRKESRACFRKAPRRR